MADEATVDAGYTPEQVEKFSSMLDEAKNDDGDAVELGDKGKKALQSEREARKQAERELNELREWRARQEESTKSESEKVLDRVRAAETERDQAISRLDTVQRRSAVVEAAVAAQVIDPGAVWALIQAECPDTISVDRRSGQIRGVDEALERVLDAHPYLSGVRPGSFDGGARNAGPRPNANADLNAVIRRGAGYR